MLTNKTPEKLKETMKIILTDSDDNIFREYPGLLKKYFILLIGWNYCNKSYIRSYWLLALHILYL